MAPPDWMGVRWEGWQVRGWGGGGVGCADDGEGGGEGEGASRTK